jgi:hypothetical protein
MGVGIVIMVCGLLLFGIVYDLLVTHLNQRPAGHRGYTAFLVVVGVAVTVTATLPIIGFENYLILVIAFIASGIPMITGDMRRYMDERDIELSELRNVIRQQLDQMATRESDDA